MIYFKNIIFFLFLSVLFCYKTDSSIVSIKKINPKAILIPDFDLIKTDFNIQFLKKNKNLFLEFDFGYIDQSSGARLNISPILKYKNFNFKINLDYVFNGDSISYDNEWNDTFDLLNRIEHFQLSLLDNKFNLFLGDINHLNFGHGYLLNNYSNNYDYPLNRNLGLILKLRNSNNSINYTLFASSLEDLFNEGGLIGGHISTLISNTFPMRLGFGYVTDLDQFINYRKEIENISRRVDAFEFDFTFPLFQNSNKRLFFIGELSAIDIPDKRYYKRVDDDQFTNDKKSRNGTWGVAFPGVQYIGDYLECKLVVNYNSSVYSPYYFNATYDFEKVRYRKYNIAENELFYPDEEELLSSFSTSDNSIFIPKDMYSMISDYENVYPTYGFSSSIKFKPASHHQMNIEYSYFRAIDVQFNDSFINTIFFNYMVNKKLLFFITELELFASKDFFQVSEGLSFKENTIFGGNVSINIYKDFSIFGNFKNTFYDTDLDGDVDSVPYINLGMKYKY